MLVGLALMPLACVPFGGYVNPARAPSSAAPSPETSSSALLSAQLSAFAVEPAGGSGPRTLDADERSLDRMVVVFARELDPTTVDPRHFAILRGDGRRVRPVRAVLAPADEGDENRSLTLYGNFGGSQAAPVALHVIGQLYAETGESLEGLDAEILGPEQPDRAVLVERLRPNASRCPGAGQVVRVYWSDRLGPVSSASVAAIELRLADGQRAHPLDFDDQASVQPESESESESEPAAKPSRACAELRGECSGLEDDNVLDLCVEREVAVVHLRIAAGALHDASGNPSALVDVDLTAASLPSHSTP